MLPYINVMSYYACVLMELLSYLFFWDFYIKIIYELSVYRWLDMAGNLLKKIWDVVEGLVDSAHHHLVSSTLYTTATVCYCFFDV